MNTLLASLYLGKLSRDTVPKVPRKGQMVDPDFTVNTKWSEYEELKRNFLARHPELKKKLNQFIAAESEKWGDLFSDLFKKHSLYVFVVDNVPVSEYYY